MDRLSKGVERIRNFADRAWYLPLVGLLAALDQLILVIPIEWVLIPGVLVKPRRWLVAALWTSLGCALGAVALAALSQQYGQPFLERYLPSVLESARWKESSDLVRSHGPWAVFLISLSPIPHHPAIAFAALSRMPLPQILAAVWAARTIKYAILAWIASHAPRLLAKVPGADKFLQKK